MDKILGIFAAAPTLGNRRDDNFVDRLNNRYTVVILVASAIIVTASMWVGSAITCWTPVHFHGSHTAFTNSYCWVRNTYYIPWEEEVPRQSEDRKMVPYYQWIPFILLGQAVLFYLPKVIWNGLNQKVGIDADNILDAAQSFNNAEKKERKQQLLDMIIKQLHRCLASPAGKYYEGWRCNIKDIVVKLLRPCGQKYGNYLSMLYIFCKMLYIVNVIGQLFMLNGILSTEYSIYGVELLDHIVHGRDWTEAPHVAFPRVTFCDFNVRRLGNVHRYTVQCLLPINMYNEKIYMFLWFWMVFISLASVLDFLIWVARYFMTNDKVTFVSKHLNFLKSEKERTDNKEEVEKFVERYLKQDGVFLLRLIGQNTSNICVTDITRGLWDTWQEFKKSHRTDKDSMDSSQPSTSDMVKEPLLQEPSAPDEDNTMV